MVDFSLLLTNWWLTFPAIAIIGSFVLRDMRTNKGIQGHTNALQRIIKNPSPNTIVFAFDIHDVIFKSDCKQICAILWNMKHKTSFMLKFLQPHVIRDVFALLKKRAVAEEYIVALANKHQELQPFVPTGIAIANAQKPMLPTIDIIKKLHDKGYELHILSNIGQTIFKDLHQEFPDVFDRFVKVRVASPHDNYARKPYPAIYEDYLAQFGHDKRTVLFIDDRLENIDTAVNLGIVGVPFKSAPQLMQLLQELDIL